MGMVTLKYVCSKASSRARRESPVPCAVLLLNTLAERPPLFPRLPHPHLRPLPCHRCPALARTLLPLRRRHVIRRRPHSPVRGDQPRPLLPLLVTRQTCMHISIRKCGRDSVCALDAAGAV